MSTPVPSSLVPVTDPATGRNSTAWLQFFAGLVSQPAPIAALAVGASPFAYTASSGGSLAVSGGTVSDISITRNTVTAATGLTSGLIPIVRGDVVTITYSSAPTVSLIPS